MTKKFINPNDLRTPKEIERDRKHTQICTEYKVLRKANPNVSVYRIFSVLGSSYDMTQMGVMRLLQRRGLYHIQRATK